MQPPLQRTMCGTPSSGLMRALRRTKSLSDPASQYSITRYSRHSYMQHAVCNIDCGSD